MEWNHVTGAPPAEFWKSYQSFFSNVVEQRGALPLPLRSITPLIIFKSAALRHWRDSFLTFVSRECNKTTFRFCYRFWWRSTATNDSKRINPFHSCLYLRRLYQSRVPTSFTFDKKTSLVACNREEKVLKVDNRKSRSIFDNKRNPKWVKWEMKERRGCSRSQIFGFEIRRKSREIHAFLFQPRG